MTAAASPAPPRDEPSAARSLPLPRVGLSMTATFMRTSGPPARDVVRAAADAGLDYLQVGDHVSFLDGTGFDGLLLAATALAQQETMPVHVGLYLLALRHPLIVAREIADLERLAPGRLVLGIGVGGEDRREFENCGVNPATRGRRTDESIVLLRQLLSGDVVSTAGEFFSLEDARIAPPPVQTVPLLVGGRSDAALLRTARYGDGWLALWVSPERFANAVTTIDEHAARAGRAAPQWQHGLNLWCGIDSDRASGQAVLARAMQERYKMPFERFERWCPTGSADDIATFIGSYVTAGCSSITLVLHDSDPFAAVRAAAAVRKHVRDRRS